MNPSDAPFDAWRAEAEKTGRLPAAAALLAVTMVRDTEDQLGLTRDGEHDPREGKLGVVKRLDRLLRHAKLMSPNMHRIISVLRHEYMGGP
jgi:hypothetical protein